MAPALYIPSGSGFAQTGRPPPIGPSRYDVRPRPGSSGHFRRPVPACHHDAAKTAPRRVSPTDHSGRTQRVGRHLGHPQGSHPRRRIPGLGISGASDRVPPTDTAGRGRGCLRRRHGLVRTPCDRRLYGQPSGSRHRHDSRRGSGLFGMVVTERTGDSGRLAGAPRLDLRPSWRGDWPCTPSGSGPTGMRPKR